MDKEMMKALKADAAMLEAMGAGEQQIDFYDEDWNLLCESCFINYADFESKICVGCQAYKDHQC